MKRIIGLLLVMLLVVSALFSGCGEQANINDGIDPNENVGAVVGDDEGDGTLVEDAVPVVGENKNEAGDAFISDSSVKTYADFKKYTQQKNESFNIVRNINAVGRSKDLPLDRLMDTSKPFEYYEENHYPYSDENYVGYGKVYFADIFNWGVNSVYVIVHYLAPDVFDNINDFVFLSTKSDVNFNSGKDVNWGGMNVIPYAYNKNMFTGTDISFLTDSYSDGYVYVNFNNNISALYKDGVLIRMFYLYKDITVTVYAPKDTLTIPDVKDSVNGFVADLMNLETMSSVAAKFDAAMKAEYGTAN